MAVTPFQLIEPFSMDSFNSRISEINTMFGGLGNEYVWEKIASQVVYDSTNISSYGIITSGITKPATYYYSDSFHIDGTNFVLTDPQSKTVTTSDWAQADTYSFLKGKYFRLNGTSENQLPFIPSDATISRADSGGQVIVAASVATVYKNIRTEYTTVGYVNSPDPNAYPPAVSDGYTYTPLGQLGAKVQIATGSYTGTGVYLASLTFDFTPKIVIIAGGRKDYNVGAFPYIWGDTVLRLQYANYSKRCTVTINGNQMSWINPENDVDFALNYSGITYRYIAIG